MLIFTDSVLEHISSGIAAHDPERGGALFGLKDSNVICHLICDCEAQRSHALYFPSPSLQREVHAAERQTKLVFRGIVHSHPGHLCEPSRQDLVAFDKSLAENLHIASFVAPIVTRGGARSFDRHEIKLATEARMSTYVARRAWRKTSSGRSNSTEIERCAVSIMPIDEHVSLLCSALDIEPSDAKIQRGYFSIGHVSYISVSFHFYEVEVIALFPPIYPIAPPLVMLSLPNRDSFFIDLAFGKELNGSLDQPNWVSRLATLIRAPGGYVG